VTGRPGFRPAALAAVVATVLVAAGLLGALSLGALGPAGATPSGSPERVGRVPAFSHAYVLVLENKSYDQIIGSTDAPYLNELAAGYGLAERYAAVASPSQPNYIALVSGSTQGIADNEPHDVTAPTLFDQLEAAGRTWRVFAENVPLDCYREAFADGGRDGEGRYARKHEPAISFTGISGNPARCAGIVDLTSFDPEAADFELIVPNLCHDMHDCSIAEGDAWLRTFVPRILESPGWRAGGVLVVTFDEGEEADDFRVATVVAAPGVGPGLRSDTAHTHYSLLRTIQEAWGLDCLGESCTAGTLDEFFR
jgi:hypothetical protein